MENMKKKSAKIRGILAAQIHRVCAIALTAVIVFSMAACASDDGSTEEVKNDTPSNNNNSGGGTGDNWLYRKSTSYRVTNGVAGDVSNETNYNWIIYRITSDTDYEQKITLTQTSIPEATSTSTQTTHVIRNGQNAEQTFEATSSYVSGSNTQTQSQTSHMTFTIHLATGLTLRREMTSTQTITTNGVTTGPTTNSGEQNFTVELISNTDGVQTYKYHDTSEDAGKYTLYKYQNGKRVEEKEYRNGELSSTEKITYTDNTTVRQYYTGTAESLNSTETWTTVTIKPGLDVSTTNRVYSSSQTQNYSETVELLSDTGTEVVVRRKRFNNSNVLTQQTDATYRK